MRNICNIVYTINDIIKYNKKDVNIGFINAIDSLIKSISYSAPELLETNYYFKVLAQILNHYISKDDYIDVSKPWAKDIIDVFTNKKIDC